MIYGKYYFIKMAFISNLIKPNFFASYPFMIKRINIKLCHFTKIFIFGKIRLFNM